MTFEEIEELLECSVCMESFGTDQNNVPRVLPCQHTFCHSCIARMVKKNRVSCPTCRHRHKCNDVDLIPKNLTLLRLLDVHPSESKLKIRKCCKCLKRNAFCQTCFDADLCDICAKDNLLGNIRHLRVTLSEIDRILCEISAVKTHWNEARTNLSLMISDIKQEIGGHELKFVLDNFAALEAQNFTCDIANLEKAEETYTVIRDHAYGVLSRIEKNIREGKLSSSIAEELSNVAFTCSCYSDDIALAKMVAFFKSHLVSRTVIGLSSNEPERRRGKSGSLRRYWSGLANVLNTGLFILLVAFALSYFGDYLSEGFCQIRPAEEWRDWLCAKLYAARDSFSGGGIVLVLVCNLLSTILYQSLKEDGSSECVRKRNLMKFKKGFINYFVSMQQQLTWRERFYLQHLQHRVFSGTGL